MMGNRLQEVLEREEVTAYRLCKDLGIDKGQLSRFINGKQNISLDKMELIAEYLGYDLLLVKSQDQSRKGAK
jgi:transcriptional regulator with XRE-family HTH domain